MNQLDDDDPSKPSGRSPAQTGSQRMLEIGGADRRRRLIGLFSYVLVYAAVATALVILFARFTASFAWALALVAFMVAYMAIMARWASRHTDRRDW